MDSPTDPTPEPRPSPLRHDADARLPAAAYLRYASRADGWGAGRQAAFLSHLADHGVVADAARSVGMSLGGGYALRRTARGYPFNLGWEAALIIARRIVADSLMAAAIRGEQSRWSREEGVTTYVRQNTKLSLVLLDRINPAAALPEVLAVATRFDWYLQLIDEGATPADLWDLFFDDALPKSEGEARARVRAALHLCEETAAFDDDGEEDSGKGHGVDEAPIEYKSMDAESHPPRIRAKRPHPLQPGRSEMMRMFLALGVAVAASSSAAGASESVAGTGAPGGGPDTRYCMRLEAFTGSRIEPLKCWTRAQWEARGVDVDMDWAKNGVRTVD